MTQQLRPVWVRVVCAGVYLGAVAGLFYSMNQRDGWRGVVASLIVMGIVSAVLRALPPRTTWWSSAAYDVRALCRNCGWYRDLGIVGTIGDRRFVMRIVRCEANCNVVSARVRSLPLDAPLPAEYRDLGEESRAKGTWMLAQTFAPLFEGRVCPRCHTGERLGLRFYRKWNA